MMTVTKEMSDVELMEYLDKKAANLKEKIANSPKGELLRLMKVDEVPYYWQLKAIEKWKEHGNRGVVIAPTGSGKTNVAFIAMKETACRTLVIVPTEAILHRWRKDLLNRLESSGATVGEYYGLKKHKGDVDVGIINSVSRNLDMLSSYEFVIIDEIHHLASEEYCHIIPLLKGKMVLGLTSTFERGDSREELIELGTDKIENIKWPDLNCQPIKVVYRYYIRQAIQDGVISDIRITTKGVKLQCSCNNLKYVSVVNGKNGVKTILIGKSRTCELHQYEEITDNISKLWAQLHPKSMAELFKMGLAGRRLMGLISRRKSLLSEASNKPLAVLNIINEHKGEKILIFSESIKSIEKARKFVESAGVVVGMYHSKMKDNERNMLLEEWEKGKFNVLMSVRALDEGINIPDCKVGIVIASGKGNRQWTQRVGRILRATGVKAHLYIVHCTNTYEDGFITNVNKLLRGVE